MYYQLRQQMIARSLSDDAKKTLVQSFVSCPQDYWCNALLYCISGGLIQRLQSIQKAAAWLVTGARRRDHITPEQRHRHRLPVKQIIDFKLAVLVGLSAQYIICRMTVKSSRIFWDVDISGLPTSTRVSSRGHSHRLATGVSL